MNSESSLPSHQLSNITAAFHLYAVLGAPVKHSRSPFLFNNAFIKHHDNALYFAIEQSDTQKAFEAVKTIGVKGLSVTIPHKTKALKYVDRLDITAEDAGALNTVINENGLLTGYNYDGEGALNALRNRGLLKQPYVILGAGGAARGIVLSLLREKLNTITFVVRDLKRFAPLKKELVNKGVSVNTILFQELKSGSLPGSDRNLFPPNSVVINTTPVGMEPQKGISPLPPDFIRPDMTVYDIVYTPHETQLLKDAKKAGAAIIYGREMFLGQAALQYRLWMKKEAPIAFWNKIF